MKLKILVIAWMMIDLMSSACQAASDDSLRTVYNHGLNTDAWSAMLYFRTGFTPGSSGLVLENAETSRLKVTGSQDKWKDRHLLTALYSDTLRDHWIWNVQGIHQIFVDKLTGFENDIETRIMATEIMYRHNAFDLPVLLGLKQDQRFRQSDTGLSYRLNLIAPEVPLDEYVHQLNGRIDGDILGPRRNSEQIMDYRVYRYFYQNTVDTLNIRIHGLRRDYYITPEGQIESREDNTQSIDNYLTYHIGPHTKMNMTGRLTRHQLQIHLLDGSEKEMKRTRRDVDIFGLAQLAWQRRRTGGIFRISHQIQEEHYQISESQFSSPYSGSSLLQTPDNISSATSYLLETTFPVGFADTLFLKTNFRKFQYDTPDEGNTDDRDEIRWHIDLGYSHRFSPSLMISTAISAHLLHMVYIHGEKSADNNWKRIFQLEPCWIWQPAPGWRWKQTTTVLANYVDYDFDTELAGIRSFLFRKFQIEDSLEIPVTPKTRVLANYKLELDENGKIIWDEWLEQKLIDRTSQTGSIHLDFRIYEDVYLRPGYSFFTRDGIRYQTQPDGTREKKSYLNFQSHGPCLQGHYQGQRLRMVFSAQTIRTQTLDVKRQIYTRLDFRLHWCF
ncbi:hypothetical protein JW948_02955 [bacterium]|nr:hypothetical protein [bacterium]